MQKKLLETVYDGFENKPSPENPFLPGDIVQFTYEGDSRLYEVYQARLDRVLLIPQGTYCTDAPAWTLKLVQRDPTVLNRRGGRARVRIGHALSSHTHKQEQCIALVHRGFLLKWLLRLFPALLAVLFVSGRGKHR